MSVTCTAPETESVALFAMKTPQPRIMLVAFRIELLVIFALSRSVTEPLAAYTPPPFAPLLLSELSVTAALSSMVSVPAE